VEWHLSSPKRRTLDFMSTAGIVQSPSINKDNCGSDNLCLLFVGGNAFVRRQSGSTTKQSNLSHTKAVRQISNENIRRTGPLDNGNPFLGLIRLPFYSFLFTPTFSHYESRVTITTITTSTQSILFLTTMDSCPHCLFPSPSLYLSTVAPHSTCAHCWEQEQSYHTILFAVDEAVFRRQLDEGSRTGPKWWTEQQLFRRKRTESVYALSIYHEEL